MVVDQSAANNRRTDTDGDAFPAMLLFGTCPYRGGYQTKTKNRGDRHNQLFREFHFQPPL
jgi:hypothetical protein